MSRCLAVWVVSGGLALAQGAPAPAPPRTPPTDLKLVEDVQYCEGVAREPRRNRLDLYVPRAVDAPPLVMFVHGGAWTGGNKEFGAPLAHALAQHGIACACINTQLYPFAPPAAMVADCGRALAWLHTHAREHGYDGDRLFVMGHSSGGQLVAWLALDDERLAEAGVPRACLRGAIALSGVYELRARHPVLEKVFGRDPAVRRDGSPLVHASAGDPPMRLVWGEHDMAGLSLCGRMLRDRLRDAGVPVIAEELAGRDHVDYVFALSDPADPVLGRIAAFVEAPPSSPAKQSPPAALRERTGLATPVPVRLAAGACELLRPQARPAVATVLWVVADEGERALAAAVGAALVPLGAAVVRLDGVANADAAAAAWRELRARAKALGLPAPTCLGGAARGGRWCAAAPLTRRDGLRGRIVAGSALGARSLSALAPGEPSPNLLATLGGARGERAALLLLQSDGDPQELRDDAIALGVALLQRQVDVHVIETDRGTTAAAMARLGDADDVLLPALRAFVLP